MNEETVNILLKQHENRLDGHNSRLDKIEVQQAETNARIDNLCKSIDSLTGALKWIIGVSVTSLGGFFLFVVQSLI